MVVSRNSQIHISTTRRENTTVDAASTTVQSSAICHRLHTSLPDVHISLKPFHDTP